MSLLPSVLLIPLKQIQLRLQTQTRDLWILLGFHLWSSHCSLNVLILLQILDVLRIDDKKFSVQLNMYFGVHWTETRLRMPSRNTSKTYADDTSWLAIDLNFMQHLWVPNVFVYNLASFQALSCLEKLAGLWIIDKQNLFYNQAS